LRGPTGSWGDRESPRRRDLFRERQRARLVAVGTRLPGVVHERRAAVGYQVIR
jgi:hypothetical protein